MAFELLSDDNEVVVDSVHVSLHLKQILNGRVDELLPVCDIVSQDRQGFRLGLVLEFCLHSKQVCLAFVLDGLGHGCVWLVVSGWVKV